MTKKVEIKGMEEALAKLPEDERADAREAIEAAFKDFDPAQPVGQPVIRITGTEERCPTCGEKLQLADEIRATAQMPDLPRLGSLAGKVVEFAECAHCEQPFMLEATS